MQFCIFAQNYSQNLRAHILPLTNCAFNKSGDKFITGSYAELARCGTQSLETSCSLSKVTEMLCMQLHSTTHMGTKLLLVLSVSRIIVNVHFACGCNTLLFLESLCLALTLSFKLTRILQTRLANCGVLRRGSCTTPTEGMLQRSCACPSTHTAQCSPLGRWTTPHGCGTWRPGSACTPYWGTPLRSCPWTSTLRGSESSQAASTTQ